VGGIMAGGGASMAGGDALLAGVCCANATDERTASAAATERAIIRIEASLTASKQ
jgi:hypothetical protein